LIFADRPGWQVYAAHSGPGSYITAA
jgi:hypothetical protein